ncbi:MAG: hypothetical protein P8174_07120 [Gemmatimonadota bacterium]
MLLAPDADAAMQQVPARNSASAMVPIAWSYQVVAVPGDMIPCVQPDGSPVVDETGQPTFIPVNWAFTGQLSHVGQLDPELSTAAFSTCVGGMDPARGPILSGDAIVHLAGPQGDAVDLSGTLTLVLAAGYAEATWTITGGSGRFADAAGYIETLEYPSADGAGSTGKGSGMVTRPQPVVGGR